MCSVWLGWIREGGRFNSQVKLGVLFCNVKSKKLPVKKPYFFLISTRKKISPLKKPKKASESARENHFLPVKIFVKLLYVVKTKLMHVKNIENYTREKVKVPVKNMGRNCPL